MIARDEVFAESFPSLYQQIDAVTHAPGTIPHTQCSLDFDSQLLASPMAINVRREIQRLLPVGPALAAHVRAGFRGYESMREYVGWLRRRIFQ
jgi:hypothetical protein